MINWANCLYTIFLFVLFSMRRMLNFFFLTSQSYSISHLTNILNNTFRHYNIKNTLWGFLYMNHLSITRSVLFASL